ncbi:MAG: sigma-70 family RNA polymerase sigma factor [Bacteroidales bacterium]|nr:sigma-70 family RNA polymerase sigma factor [Bacteroidales bacterium]
MESNKGMGKKATLISEWVEDYTGNLYSWALHKISDPELASDMVQDTFLAATEKIEAFKGDSAPKTWLFSILNHKIVDHYRNKIKKPVNIDTNIFSSFFDEEGSWKKEKRPHNWEEDTHLLDDKEFRAVLKKCLDALPDQWSTTVKLKYLMSKKGEEICQEMGISTTNYWQIVHRAKLQLRECIEQKWFND